MNPETTAYRVYLDDGSGNGPKLFYDSSPRALTNIYTLTALKVGESYDATVRAVNELGESLPSFILKVHAGVAPS